MALQNNTQLLSEPHKNLDNEMTDFNSLFREPDKSRSKYRDLKLDSPQLVLGIEMHPGYHEDFKWSAEREWYKIAHPSAGRGCSQHFLQAIFLEPRKEFLPAINRINKTWLGSDLGLTKSVDLDEILRYRKELQAIGLDCKWSYADFEEAYYPIDCSTDNMDLLLENNDLPNTLDDLIREENSWKKVLQAHHRRWKLLILGKNFA
jgi:hypothetical protein